MPNKTEWLRQLSLNRSPMTVKTYSDSLTRFEKWGQGHFGDFDLGRLTHVEVQLFMKHLANAFSVSTINVCLSAISSWCRYSNQTHAVKDIHKKTEVDQRNIEWLEEKQCDDIMRSMERGEMVKDSGKKLIKHMRNSLIKRNLAIFALLRYTGIRVSELCDLNMDDLTISERKGRLHVLGKGDKERFVPVPAEARHYLSQYLQERPEAGTKALFLTWHKEPKRISVRAVQDLLANYDIHPHQLRHTYVHGLVMDGVDIVSVADLAGHDDIQTTRRYAKASYRDLEDIVERHFEKNV